ncbi:MAG: HlyD family efflux transporter periplasmic adaptor subunit [Lentisphaeria bacterium]|nr:MAG: HlyD family efflux transporter periplasmic adaptor subunit [Lentisphaeria bacterium]
MQTSTLEAEKAATLANIKVQEGELAMARATVKLKESAFSGAEKEFKRQSALISSNAVSQRVFDEAETKYNNAKADLEYARANVIAAEGRVAEQKAELQRIEADLADSTLVAAYDGRIQYLLAHEGEVLSAGGRVMNLVNLTDTYMTFFLPTSIAGRVQMGAEVKLIFDAAPRYAINAGSPTSTRWPSLRRKAWRPRSSGKS